MRKKRSADPLLFERTAFVWPLTGVRRWTVRTAAVAVTMTVACFPAAPRAQAQTAPITVTNLNDGGPGSLRAAIAQSASVPPGQNTVINFTSGLTGTILLNSTLSICNGQTLTIQGPTASQIAASGQNQVPVFNVCLGTNVTISHLTIENGLGAGISDNLWLGGGGIQNLGVLTVTGSTFVGNSAGTSLGILSANGGGIFNLGTLTVTDSTFYGNSAPGGGAIINWGSSLVVNHSTFSGNSGGGIIDEVPDGTGEIRIKSTLLAGNTPFNCFSTNVTFGSQGYNLSDDASCRFGNTGDMNSTPADLDPKGLQTNGGPTPTIALLPSSPAVDAIPVSDCTDTDGNPVTQDQRGTARPQGKGCDIGAYELIQTVPFASFQANLLIFAGKPYSYVFTSVFTLAAASTPINPATAAVTLKIADYSLTIPAGSFREVGSGLSAIYVYDGTSNGVKTGVVITQLGSGRYGFGAAGSPVDFTAATNPIQVMLTIGNDNGKAAVNAMRLR